jgi:YwiC-like protein
MFPKEHGAYGQLLLPLATSLLVARRTTAALCFAAAAVFAFLAHEPLLVVLGQRGPRAARDLRRRAISWLTATGVAAMAFGVAAVVTAPARIEVALAAPTALLVALAVVIALRREHTMAGEILAALTFASLTIPVVRAGHGSWYAASTCAAVFAAAFIAATVCVHAVIARMRRPPATGARVGGTIAAVTSIVILWFAAAHGVISIIAPAAVVPICAIGAGVAIAAPSGKRLRTIGWSLVATTVMAAALLVLALG